MSKSYCNGCKRWKKCNTFAYSPIFYYCTKYAAQEKKERDLVCGGRYKEPAVISTPLSKSTRIRNTRFTCSNERKED